MKYGPHKHQISCTPLTTLWMAIFTLRKGKLNGKIIPHVFPFLSGAAPVYSMPVTILHIKTFVTFDITASLLFMTDY